MGQLRGALGALADRRGRLGGLSLEASIDPFAVECLCSTLGGAFMSLRSEPGFIAGRTTLTAIRTSILPVQCCVSSIQCKACGSRFAGAVPG